MSLASKTVIAGIWNFAEQLGLRGITTIITLLLARFLDPSAYGLMSMIAIFLAVGTSLMDSGFRQSLIRLKGATQVDFNTAFYSNLVLGFFSYLIIFFTAPFIADFYKDPRLISLIRVTSLTIIINSFQTVQRAELIRNLNFKAQLQSTIPSGILSGLVAIGLAYLGFGVWALVTQMLLGALFTTIFLWLIQGWRPSMLFSRASFFKLYSFGIKLFFSGLIDIIFNNIYVITIAKIFSASIAGHYFFAHKIKDLLVQQIVSSIQNVTYPAFSKLQDDNTRLRNGYRKVISVSTFVLFPIMIAMVVLIKPFFILVLPAKWLPTVPYLQLECIIGLMYPLHSINLNILKVKGRSDLFLYLEIIKKGMAVIVLIFSIRYGVIGILIGQIFTSVLSYIPNSYFSKKLIGYSVREQIMDFGPYLILSFVTGGLIYLGTSMTELQPVADLLLFGCTGFCLYLSCAYVFKLEGLSLSLSLVKHKKTTKKKSVVCEISELKTR